MYELLQLCYNSIPMDMLTTLSILCLVTYTNGIYIAKNAQVHTLSNTGYAPNDAGYGGTQNRGGGYGGQSIITQPSLGYQNTGASYANTGTPYSAQEVRQNSGKTANMCR